MYPPNLKSVALRVPEMRGVAKLHTPNLEEGDATWGSGMVACKRALVSSTGPPYILFHTISTRLPEILNSFQWGLRTPKFWEGEAIGGRGWYRSKERC